MRAALAAPFARKLLKPIGPERAAGRAADSLVMPDSSPEAPAKTSGVRVGNVYVYPEPPYNRLSVSDESGKSYRGDAALCIIFAELRGIAANAANPADVASAIAASVELV